MLVRSLVLPAFTYSESVYSTNLSASNVRSLERAFSACVRFVYSLRRYDSTREYIGGILGCSLMTYLKQRRCCFIHAMSRSEQPPYLFEKLCIGRSSRNRVFVIPRHSSAQYNRSFFVRAVSDYNSIPMGVKSLVSQSGFDRASREYFNAR